MLGSEVRVLQGSKVTDAAPDWRERLGALGWRVVVDLGAGDGRYVYESARADTLSVYLGIDPDAEALAEYAYRAARKPSRGGVDNALFVVASVEHLPAELSGVADQLRVNFPWGSLLRGLLEPDPATLRGLASLLRTGGAYELVMSYDPAHDTGAFAAEALPLLDAAYVDDVLLPAYGATGLPVTGSRRLTQDEALAIPSTWGRRLLHARPRDVFSITGVLAAGR
jgi:16S rRNA (adenine(1408)-N(1))-methyltransferase